MFKIATTGFNYLFLKTVVNSPVIIKTLFFSGLAAVSFNFLFNGETSDVEAETFRHALYPSTEPVEYLDSRGRLRIHDSNRLHLSGLRSLCRLFPTERSIESVIPEPIMVETRIQPRSSFGFYKRLAIVVGGALVAILLNRT